MFFIYLLQNKINNKIYVGLTKNLRNRIYQHRSRAKTHNYYIYNAINKYGEENFQVIELESFVNFSDVVEAEKFWIQFFRSWDKNFGYNLTLGGEGTFGKKLSKQHKKKISKSLLGNNNAKGSIRSDNWKEDMSIKHAGEKNAKAKLTIQDVLDIRKFYAENNSPNIFKQLSNRYHLSISGLEKIIYRKTWKHI